MFIKPRFFFAACLILVACETTNLPAEMDPVAYQSLYAEAESSGSIIHIERLLTDLLVQPELSTEQRADALLLRAQQRQKFNFNLPAAIADYQAYLATMPEENVSSEIANAILTAESEVARAQSRLTALQTLDNWFADKVRLGALDEAAARQRRSKITPSDLHTYVLREAGYICAAPQGTEKVHHFGPVPEYARGLVWCEVTETS